LKQEHETNFYKQPDKSVKRRLGNPYTSLFCNLDHAFFIRWIKDQQMHRKYQRINTLSHSYMFRRIRRAIFREFSMSLVNCCPMSWKQNGMRSVLCDHGMLLVQGPVTSHHTDGYNILQFNKNYTMKQNPWVANAPSYSKTKIKIHPYHHIPKVNLIPFTNLPAYFSNTDHQGDVRK
jgi:hypothetical protein